MRLCVANLVHRAFLLTGGGIEAESLWNLQSTMVKSIVKSRIIRMEPGINLWGADRLGQAAVEHATALNTLQPWGMLPFVCEE